MDDLVRACQVVVDVDAVNPLAARSLRLFPLRAFDAPQLGAALHWAEGHPQERMLHTLDSRLALAAEREGFVVPSMSHAVARAIPTPKRAPQMR